MSVRSRRRIWCELFRAGELLASGALPALADRGISLLFAVTPGDTSEARKVIRACREAHVGVGLWPMLEPERGRWANELSAHELCPFAEALLDELGDVGALPDELAIDLEPPFELLASRSAMSLVRFARGDRARGTARLAAWAAKVRGHGVRVVAAALPTVLADGNAQRWQRLLATPVDALGADHVSAMMYSSMVEGYARGMLTREDVRSLVAMAARAASGRAGYGLSLGAIGTGSLGDEPVYRNPGELADDVSLARGAGVEALALFSLCGALRRGSLEPWLDAFVHALPCKPPPPTARAKVIWQAARWIGGAPEPQR
jgi:hypothetical protein